MNAITLASGLIVPTTPTIIQPNTVTLFNAACWHQKKANNAKDVRDQLRHEVIADRLFLASHRAKED